MCLLAVINHPTSEILQAVFHNRDEVRSRPFTPGRIHYSTAGPLFYGTDEAGGGTWLTIGSQRWAAALNLRLPHEASSKKFRSRGELPILAQTAGDPLAEVQPASYRPFRLIVGSPHAPTSQTSSSSPNLLTRSQTGSETYTNHERPNELWFKESRALELLSASIHSAHSPNDIAAAGFSMLMDTTFSDRTLPDYTGLPAAMERVLSSIFVSIPERDYGTVISTVAIYLRSGEVLIWEKNHLIGVLLQVTLSPSSPLKS